MDIIISFIVGVVIGAIIVALILRNNPKMISQIDILAKQVEELANEIKKLKR